MRFQKCSEGNRWEKKLWTRKRSVARGKNLCIEKDNRYFAFWR